MAGPARRGGCAGHMIIATAAAYGKFRIVFVGGCKVRIIARAWNRSGLKQSVVYLCDLEVARPGVLVSALPANRSGCGADNCSCLVPCARTVFGK